MNYALICLLSLVLAPAWANPVNNVSVSDPVMGVRHIVYERLGAYALVEGDILLAPIAQLKAHFAMTTALANDSRWKNNTLPYEISDDLPPVNRSSVMQALDHWKKNTSIRFIELTPSNRSLYTDYVSFVKAPDGTTCASFVGRKGGKQDIILAPRCTPMITVHEIGHALGLWHEQSRTDRDQYIKIIWENISEGHEFNFVQKFTEGNDFGPYDYDSIMHYSAYAFSKNGEQTIIPLIEGAEIGKKRGLSEKDIAAINHMYPSNNIPSE